MTGFFQLSVLCCAAALANAQTWYPAWWNVVTQAPATTQEPGSGAWLYFCIVRDTPYDEETGKYLKLIECTGDDMTTIPFLPADLRRELGYYRASHSQAKNVHASVFKNAAFLRYVYLNDNEIRKISNGAFDAATNLEFLSLRNNVLTSVEPGIFNHLSKLWFLDLSNNGLQTMHRTPYMGLTSVRYLNLADNPVQVIECGFFENFVPAINYLNMSRTISQCRVDLPQDSISDGMLSEVQCNCDGYGYTRSSYCSPVPCSNGVNPSTAIRIQTVTLNVHGPGWLWIAEVLQAWKQDLHDTLIQARLHPLSDSAEAELEAKNDGGMSPTLIVVCSVGAVGMLVGIVVVSRRGAAAHEALTEETTTIVSTELTMTNSTALDMYSGGTLGRAKDIPSSSMSSSTLTSDQASWSPINNFSRMTAPLPGSGNKQIITKLKPNLSDETTESRTSYL